jgi:hypothetical protein
MYGLCEGGKTEMDGLREWEGETRMGGQGSESTALYSWRWWRACRER